MPEEKQGIIGINLVREETGAIVTHACQLAIPAASCSAPMAETGTLFSLTAPVMKLEMNGARLKISNRIDPAFLIQVLQALRSAAY